MIFGCFYRTKGLMSFSTRKKGPKRLFFFFHLIKNRDNRDNSVGQILYEGECMKKQGNLKKGIAVLVLLTAIGLPLACTTNNSSTPTTPITAHTPTPGGPTATATTTLVPGATPT